MRIPPALGAFPSDRIRLAMPRVPTAEKLHIVILYESLRYVGKAMATYLHLVRELGDEFTPDFHLWRLDVAAEPGCGEEVVRDIAAAGVIIVAMNGHQPCPPVFQRRRGADRDGKACLPACAIIALVEVSEGPTPAIGSWNSFLRMDATQIHPEVFVWDPFLARDDLPRSAVALVPDYPAGLLRSGNQLSTPNLQP